jgi:tetratricopeptide (TPR) repeat protein
MKRRLISLFIFLAMCTILDAQVSSSTVANRPTSGRFSLFSLTASPFLGIPIGADAAYFGLNAGGGLSAEYRLPFFPLVYVGGQLDYGYLPTIDPSMSLSTLGLSAVLGVQLQILPPLALKVFGTGGWFLAFLNGPGAPPESNPLFSGGVKLDFDLTSSWGIGAEASYRDYAGLLNDIAVRLAGTYRIPGFASAGAKGSLPTNYTPLENDGRGVGLIGIKAAPIFPVFSKYYDTHPLAEIILRNFEATPADSIKMTAIIKNYMDSPKECSVPVRIEPGRDATAKVFALFNDRLLQVAETTKFSLTLVLEYSQYGKSYRDEYAPSVSVLFRNAMTWEDSQRMAAFISARDPAAFGFTRGVLSASRNAINPALSQDLQSAILIYEALRAYGLSYVKDPSSALAAKNTTAVDSLQFPQQTLQYKSGDCDDLSILFCSLMESIGTETAFITTPGHVYPALALTVKPADALKYLGKAEDFVVQGDKVWIPLEMTALSSDFMGAWKEGSREWTVAKDKAALYPVHDAWSNYPPVVVSGTASAPPIPAATKLSASLKSGLQKLMDRELTPRAAAFLAESKKPQSTAKALNSLGVLYARYGLYDKAEEQFSALSAKGTYMPAMINLGNLYLAQKQYKLAIAQFQKILKAMPDDPSGLVGAALASDGMGDRAATKSSYDKLKASDPALADRYAFLGAAGTDATTRAASADSVAGKILWQD